MYSVCVCALDTTARNRGVDGKVGGCRAIYIFALCVPDKCGCLSF